ncbi:uncharacterized protein LOC141899474 [Tubulanus polymorphus]|uniref:uncharacterized protein LOC141899474 n=1 Tax=Tubulanus polymorphus TaxID=672921 RepID=UPI003DA44F21
MAASVRKLPNLKICVEKSDDEESNDARGTETRISSDEGEQTEVSKLEEVEFSVAIKDLDAIKQRRREQYPTTGSLPGLSATSGPKKYENRSGDFITGFNLTTEEFNEKKQQRAKRFGISSDIQPKAVTEEDLTGLYESLGITEQTIRRSERGIRPEAIHLRGTHEMSTRDVFNYFKDFSPGSIEWIDDASCNVVWMDPLTAARAMFHLSFPTSKPESKKKKPVSKLPATSESMETEKTTESNETKDEKMESSENAKDLLFDDDLDLLSDDEKENKKDTQEIKQSNENVVVSDEKQDVVSEKASDKTPSEELEDGEISDDDAGEQMAADVTNDSNQTQKADFENLFKPPGIWRIGLPYQKNELFMRFATKADKKLPGAERKSRYYQKYGNPNYGGSKGVISISRKRRLRDRQRKEENFEAKLAIELQKKDSKLDSKSTWLYDVEQELHDDQRLIDMQDSDNESMDVEFESIPSSRSPAQQKKPLFSKSSREAMSLRLEGDSDSDSSCSEPADGEEDDLQLHRRLNRLPVSEAENSDVDDNLPPVMKKRKMRMYADDEEKKIKKRKKKMWEEQVITAGASVTSAGDARDRIMKRQLEREQYSTVTVSRYRDDNKDESDDDSDGDDDRPVDKNAKTQSGVDLRSKLSSRRKHRHSPKSSTSKKYLPLRIEVTASDDD